MKKTTILILLATFWVSCKPKAQYSSNTMTSERVEASPMEEVEDTAEPAYPLPKKPGCGDLGWREVSDPSKFPSDPFDLLDARIVGRCLEIDVRHGGGCGGAVFTMVWDGSMGETVPEQTRMRLVLNNQDRCRALITRTISADIAGLNNRKAFILSLEGFSKRLEFIP
jgi:hypothetical protein